MADGPCHMDEPTAYGRWPATYWVEEEQLVERGRSDVRRVDGLGERAVQRLSHAALVQRLRQQ